MLVSEYLFWCLSHKEQSCGIPFPGPTSPARPKLLALAVATCFTSGSYALPTDPTVAAGNATFNQVGKVLNVTNSNGAIINWNTFSIGAGETTRFIQTSASSSVLNRVLSNDPSLIYGTLSSNGRVWLVNPAGIMVGAGGRVDVAGFVASTLNIRNEDFLAGKNLFQNTPGAGSVRFCVAAQSRRAAPVAFTPVAAPRARAAGLAAVAQITWSKVSFQSSPVSIQPAPSGSMAVTRGFTHDARHLNDR